MTSATRETAAILAGVLLASVLTVLLSVLLTLAGDALLR